MLKEELEKKLGIRVSMSFYVAASALYEKGPWINNTDFCKDLENDPLLMEALREIDKTWSEIEKIRSLAYRTNHWIREVIDGIETLYFSYFSLPK